VPQIDSKQAITASMDQKISETLDVAPISYIQFFPALALHAPRASQALDGKVLPKPAQRGWGG